MPFCTSHAQNPLIQTRKGAPGNYLINYVTDTKNASVYMRDPVDDTIHYKHVVDKLYEDTSGKVFVLSGFDEVERYKGDTFARVEYYQDVSDVIDLKSYRHIKDDYFTSRGKVYIWWGDMEHTFPVEIEGADAESFQPFDSIAGGKDNAHVFFGGPPSELKVIKGADPKTIKVLKPKRCCWNGSECYFADDKNVFFGLKGIQGADPKTFKLIDEEKADAADKAHRYFDGEIVKPGKK